MKFTALRAAREACLATVAWLLLLGAGSAPEPAPGAPPAPTDPNWPCQQIKLEHMSLATMWSGPPIEPYVTDWQHYPNAAQLAQRLAQRRVPLAQANSEIASFAKAAGDGQKTELLALMGGLFSLLDQERFAVIEGLDRFGVRQQGYAAQIRKEITDLHEAQDAPQPDQKNIKKLSDQIAWDTQVFSDRKSMISYACFVPDEIEHRLFALAGTISSLVP
jgi:hypothetical protein